MTAAHPDSFGAASELNVGDRSFTIYRLDALKRAGFAVERLPYSLRILLENLLRTENGASVSRADIEALAGWQPNSPERTEIVFQPARVLLQDFTGVPAIVDLAAMRDAMVRLGGIRPRSTRYNPLNSSLIIQFRPTRLGFRVRWRSTKSLITRATANAMPC